MVILVVVWVVLGVVSRVVVVASHYYYKGNHPQDQQNHHQGLAPLCWKPIIRRILERWSHTDFMTPSYGKAMLGTAQPTG